jgi:TPR repeat protein
MTPANEVRSPAEIELEFWKAVVELDEADLYQIYLDKVEKREFAGAFTELAKRKLPRAAGSAPIKIAAPAQRVAAKTAPTPPCVAGAKLDVFADGKWYPSTAKGKDAAGRCEIHYDGWDDKYDLAVGPDRMRAPEPQPVVSAEDKARLDLVKPLIAQAQAQASANNYLGAAESFEKAARAAAKIEAGHTIAADAAVLSAVDYLVAGGDSAKNLLRAGRMFKLAAELGDAGGARSYAYMLQIGYGVAKDEGRARRVLKPFAEIGDRLAMAQYGQMLMLGQGGPRELKEGREFIRKSAEGGNATGMLYHAHRLRREQGDAAAAAWYSRAAKKGNTEAMLAFGRLLLWSKEMPRDEAEGKKWLKKAADKNDPHAMFELAQILLRDAATQAEGASLAATASTFGNPEHRLFYAKLLEKGIGVPKDIARARVQYEVLLLPRSRTNRYYRKRAQLELADLRGM